MPKLRHIYLFLSAAFLFAWSAMAQAHADYHARKCRVTGRYGRRDGGCCIDGPENDVIRNCIRIREKWEGRRRGWLACVARLLRDRSTRPIGQQVEA